MQQRTQQPWIVCLTAATFFFYQFIQITMFNVLKPDLIVSLHTTPAVLDLISALYFYGTVLFLIPAGILLDYFSTRKIILLTMGISLIGLWIFAMATTIPAAAVGRFLVGVSGGPFCFTSSMRLADRWFPAQRLGLVSGIIVAMAMLGGMVAQLPFSLLLQHLGWRNTMYVNLGLGVVLWVLMYWLVFDYPAGKKHEFTQQMQYYRQHGFLSGFKKVIFQAQTWKCGLFTSLLNLPILILGALWGFMYLTQIFNLSRLQASAICSVLFFGMLLGGPVFGLISDRLLSRKKPMYAGLLLCLICTIFLLQAANMNITLGFSSLILLFFFIGFGSGAQVVGYPTVTDSNPAALAGSALGLASMLVMSGGAIAQPLVGWLIELNWNGTMINNVPILSAYNYNFGFWLMPVAMTLAACLLMLIRETHAQPLPSH